MFQITVELTPECWDEAKEEFVEPKSVKLQMEHSLVSLSKWESKWCKPFLSQKELTGEEALDYIKCMTINPNVDPDVYNHLTSENINAILEYIYAPMTATTIREDKQAKKNNEIITAELIYHWMIELQIPFECQKWHLNRLMTLIKVRNAKLTPPKKMSRREVMQRNTALNAARRKQLHSRG